MIWIIGTILGTGAGVDVLICMDWQLKDTLSAADAAFAETLFDVSWQLR
jgi:hypothetical protein